MKLTDIRFKDKQTLIKLMKISDKIPEEYRFGYIDAGQYWDVYVYSESPNNEKHNFIARIEKEKGDDPRDEIFFLEVLIRDWVKKAS